MFILPMAAPGPTQVPAIFFNHFDDISHLHIADDAIFQVNKQIALGSGKR